MEVKDVYQVVINGKKKKKKNPLFYGRAFLDNRNTKMHMFAGVPGRQKIQPGLLAGLKINKQKIKGKQRKEKALDYRFK